MSIHDFDMLIQKELAGSALNRSFALIWRFEKSSTQLHTERLKNKEFSDGTFAARESEAPNARS